MVTEQKGSRILLASQAQQKIDATIGGFRVACPIDTDARNFLVVRDSKTIPSKKEFQSISESKRITDPLKRVILGERNWEDIPTEFISTDAPHVLIYAMSSQSGVPEQPIVDPRLGFDQGFKGASNRVRSVRELNASSSHPLDYDFIVGIENAQVIFQAEEARDGAIEVAQDVGFVVVENQLGMRKFTHSGGLTFGTQNGMDYFRQSERTGFSVTAAEYYNPADRQDPHLEASDGLYTRADILVFPIASAIRQLRQATN